ncbi:MAG: ParB/RepB/Spo0J family partition protein [Coriobacteriia bacterium]|nr:ParB/RepB/Spo0J family partition protein [Coriobacteriia bacterium]
MAGKNRGGLGRGLDSLLGGSYEESMAPAKKSARTAERDRVVVDNDELPAEARVSEPATAAPQDPVEVVGEDGTVIKGVTSRRAAKPAPKPAIPAEPERRTAHPVEQPKAPEPEVPAEPKVADEIDITLIKPNPDQPRRQFKDEELEELSSSIERDGLLQPILVREMPNGTYQIIAGERRWRASQLAGLEKVPARVRKATDDEVMELALIENIQRSDLNPIEEAYGYRRIMERKGLKQAELAQMLSKGRSTIANALRLLDLPEDAQQLLFEEKITAGHARAILSISDPEGRQKLTDKLREEKLSVREAESIARLLENKPDPANAPKRAPMPKSFKKVAKDLRGMFGTGVRVKSSQGKNKIEIEFKDEEDLQRIFALMNGQGEE